MQESRLLGKLLPTSPDFLPMVEQLREKYGLPELAPDDDPLEEIFLNDEPVALEEFHREIRQLVDARLDYLPPEFAKWLVQARAFAASEPQMVEVEGLSAEHSSAITASYNATRKLVGLIVNVVDPFFAGLADMLYMYLLTGEVEEAPPDWFGRVMTDSLFGEKAIFAIANQAANPEVVVDEFRRQYRKAFGEYRPRLTPLMVSSAYYWRLQKAKKKWDFIVEEFIRLNKLKMPPRSNAKYQVQWNQISKRLRKRLERLDGILSVIIGDKK